MESACIPATNFLVQVDTKDFLQSCENENNTSSDDHEIIQMETVSQPNSQPSSALLSPNVGMSSQLFPLSRSGARSAPHLATLLSPLPESHCSSYPASPASTSASPHPSVGQLGVAALQAELSSIQELADRQSQSGTSFSHRLNTFKQRGLKSQSPSHRSLHSLSRSFSLGAPTGLKSGPLSARGINANRLLNQNSLFHRTHALLAKLQSGQTQMLTPVQGSTNSAVDLSLLQQEKDINQNFVPSSPTYQTNQAQSNQLPPPPSPSLVLNNYHQFVSQEKQNSLQDGSSPAVVSCPGTPLNSYPFRSPAVTEHQTKGLGSGLTTMALGVQPGHSAVMSQTSPTPAGHQCPGSVGSIPSTGGAGESYSSSAQSVLVSSSNGSTGTTPSCTDTLSGATPSQVPSLSLEQSYARLTSWTTKLTSDNFTPLPSPTQETLPLPLGLSNNLVLSPTAKENQARPANSPDLLRNSYSRIQPVAGSAENQPDSAHHMSGNNMLSTNDSCQDQPNKERRFKKTADALHKSGLWEVAMKTGSLIRRNRELQRELDKFRSDALTFLKSVIKNPHNRDLIKNVLSNALASKQDPGRSSSMMTVVVSAAAAAAAASVQLDSAGSTDGGRSMSGNASDSSSSNSSNCSEASFDGSFFPLSQLATTCGSVAMDVN